jgi:uncharacterized membrane protein
VTKSLVIWMALLMIAVAVPMAMRKVPPNGFYGFRTPKTMGDSRVWYDANQKAGINMIVAGVLALVVWGVLRMMVGMGRANFIGFPVLMGLLLVSVVVSFVQVQKM